VASGIAHEINNPLMVITGQVLKIKRQLKEGHVDEIEQPLSKISLMSERIVKIIKGLKLISRDGHKDPMNEFSFATMIEEIKLLTEMKIKSLDIDFSVNMPQTIDHIYGREVQISQVLVNLINNSFDAISAQEEKWIRIEVLDLNETIQVSVTDSGRGISKDLQDKIMNPFFTTKEVGKGTGLGLSISKGIVKDHGGDFYYNNHCPNTQFVFTISKSMGQQKAA
jgi:C4-dicarboxylate-specific signal transduction histidine kinase